MTHKLLRPGEFCIVTEPTIMETPVGKKRRDQGCQQQ